MREAIQQVKQAVEIMLEWSLWIHLSLIRLKFFVGFSFLISDRSRRELNWALSRSSVLKVLHAAIFSMSFFIRVRVKAGMNLPKIIWICCAH